VSGRPRRANGALVPSAFSIEAAEKWALTRAEDLPDDLFRLIAIWSVRFLVQAAPDERKACYTMKIAQAEVYGRSGGFGPVPDPDPELIGEDTRRILKDRLWRDDGDRLAVTDVVVGQVSRPPDEQVVLDDRAHAKYVARAELFADEAERVLQRRGSANFKRRRPRVLVVGATAGILAALAKRELEVFATDLSADVVGRRLGGVEVLDGASANTRLVREADLAIITGQSLANGTLPGLAQLAKEHDTSTLIWAMTGKNFGHYYTDHGVDSVISDPAPFLLLPGPATMGIWRRSH